MSHPFVERLIRIVRNDMLDQVMFWTVDDLQDKLNAFQTFFNNYRSHLGVDGKCPGYCYGDIPNNVVNINNYRWENHLNGLFSLPIAA